MWLCPNCEETQKLKVWENSKSAILTKLKNSNCDKAQKLRLWQNFNLNSYKPQKLKLWKMQKQKLWQNSTLKLWLNSNIDKTKKKLKQKTKQKSKIVIKLKLKLWHNSMIIVILAALSLVVRSTVREVCEKVTFIYGSDNLRVERPTYLNKQFFPQFLQYTKGRL